MGDVLVKKQTMYDIADAIREITSTEDKFKPSEMADAQRNFVRGLIDQSNATTGKEDTDLTSAVGHLVEGYGQGGEQDFSIEDGLITRTLTTYRNDRITTIGKNAFRECGSMTELIVPNVTHIDAYGCASCSSVKKFDFSSLTFIGQQGLALISCDKIVFPKLETIFVQAFLGASIKQLVITNTEICTLHNVSAISSGISNIYVPDNLVEVYKTATNWSTFADRIKPISELPTEEE